MNWYIVKLVFRVVSGQGAHTPQFDEQLRLISSNNSENAYKKAYLIGVDNQETLMNDKNTTVKWEFIGVADISPIEEFKDGMEMYSTTHETQEPHSYIRYIENKGHYLQNKAKLQTIHI